MNKADYDKLCGNLMEILKQYGKDYIEKEPESVKPTKEWEAFFLGWLNRKLRNRFYE